MSGCCRPPRVILSVMLVVFGAALASPAVAQSDAEEKEEFESTIHVVQQKPVVRKGRLEVTPKFGGSINDPIYQSFKAGANLSFNMSERLYVSGLFEWYDFGDALGGPTSAFTESIERSRTAPEAPILNWVGGLEVGFMPIYGKFALFNSWILYYDLGVTLGPAYLESTSIQTNGASRGLGGTGSLTGRLFFNEWMALNLELRDVIFSTDFATGAQSTESRIANVVTATAGVSFILPPSNPTDGEEGNQSQ